MPSKTLRLSASEIAWRLRSSYWFLPLIITAAAAALGAGLLTIDSRVSIDPPNAIGWLYPETPDGARALMSAIIGSMVTAISVTFSVTIVALTVAAEHFGPRVVNNFVRHTSAQLVLGTFLGTFTFAVLVLGAIGDDAGGTSVPKLASIGAVALVLLSIGALIYYIQDISGSVHVGRIAAEVAAEMTDTVRRLQETGHEAEDGEDVIIPAPPAGTFPVPALETGYLQRIDFAQLVRIAERRNAQIWIRREPGSFVLAGTPIAVVRASANGGDLAREIGQTCVIGTDRTNWQDVEFPLKQLVEIALRALSPAVNEPFTASTCIDRLTQGLAEIARAAPPRTVWRGADGCPRVFSQSQPFTMLVRAAFEPIRIFAGANPAIYVRLLDSLGELALVAQRDEDRAALARLAVVIRRQAARHMTEADDRAYLESRYAGATQNLRGVPTTARRHD